MDKAHFSREAAKGSSQGFLAAEGGGATFGGEEPLVGNAEAKSPARGERYLGSHRLASPPAEPH